MGRVVVVEKNRDGKIELTKEELTKMLDDAYSQGHADGCSRYEVISYPSITYPINKPWYTEVTCSG